ncbi:uncharacterized protein HfgLR_12565 [Haloferax gibbonsii]|uniref:Uncharacterized protein n=1 Tax=Haloferax gibbonsii TaxID=35746 RepID=A0A871BIL9_HALGI|nr:uncharacterized protein HfgLR_12565 [Haloferax gibbonsii]
MTGRGPAAQPILTAPAVIGSFELPCECRLTDESAEPHTLNVSARESRDREH